MSSNLFDMEFLRFILVTVSSESTILEEVKQSLKPMAQREEELNEDTAITLHPLHLIFSQKLP